MLNREDNALICRAADGAAWQDLIPAHREAVPA